jgi:lipid II isoglutaminyl synthase (glutamine-hydrolysing)
VTAGRRRVRLGHLYPAQMNIYADRGNIAVLARRLAWRGMELEVTELGPGAPVAPGRHDLYYLGGGQDRDQVLVAEDLARTKADGLRSAVADGAAMLCVCGGFQLAGHGYTGVDGTRMPGIGVLDLDTVADPTRLIGDLVIDARVGAGPAVRVVGFENHAGRTHLGPGARALGRVVHGHGNNGADGGEGAVQRRVIGTYLHGPLLPKNPWLADRLLAWALEHGGHAPALAPVDDALEDAARDVAEDRAARHRDR